ncbi:MAG: hypothetical protein R2861_02950 [Desulfobacterales bacterium]
MVQLVNKIILDAYAQGASDIHLEPYPSKQNTQVRIGWTGPVLYQTIPYSLKRRGLTHQDYVGSGYCGTPETPGTARSRSKNTGDRISNSGWPRFPPQGGAEDVVMRILAAGEPP